MIIFPNIDPIAFSLGPLHVRWYGLMYLVGFIAAWSLARFRVKHYHLNWTADEVGDLIFYGALGVIIGGRLGYMLFYKPDDFFHAPWTVFKTWEGGMSFHGGLLGVLFALLFFAKKTQKSFWQVGDFVAPLVPLGLAAGRLGNFINAELWGRVTGTSWGVVFPQVDDLPRHPSQLYELGLEGILLFIVIWCYAAKPRPVGRVAALFLMGYALCRFTAEFFRAPDVYLGFIALNTFTMGQLLSLPMFILGALLWWMKGHAKLS